MRGLTDLERSTLQPLGAPGEWTSDECVADLVRLGRARWTSDYLEPTELGLLALRVCPAYEQSG